MKTTHQFYEDVIAKFRETFGREMTAEEHQHIALAEHVTVKLEMRKKADAQALARIKNRKRR